MALGLTLTYDQTLAALRAINRVPGARFGNEIGNLILPAIDALFSHAKELAPSEADFSADIDKAFRTRAKKADEAPFVACGITMASKPIADVIDLNSHRTPLEHARALFNEGREEFLEASRRLNELQAKRHAPVATNSATTPAIPISTDPMFVARALFEDGRADFKAAMLRIKERRVKS